MVLRDRDSDDSTGTSFYGVPGSGLDERLWVEQGADGSVWEIRLQGGPSSAKESYAYDPDGYFYILWGEGDGTFRPLIPHSQYEWHYFWRGNRAESYDYDDGEGATFDRFDGLQWTGSEEYDQARGSPLGEDVYAYSSTLNAHSPWNYQQTRYAGAGTSGAWSEPSTSMWSYLPGAIGSTVSNAWDAFTNKGAMENGQNWWGNAWHAFWSPGDYGGMGNVTNPAWIDWTSRGLGLAGASLITLGTLGLGSGAAWASVGGMWGGAAVGGAIGGGISYARGGSFLGGAGIGADIGSIAGGIAAPAYLRSSIGGFGVFGRMTEGAYAVDAATQQALRREIYNYATSREFLAELGLRNNKTARQVFFKLLRDAEVVGSKRGGSAGLLRLAGEQAGKLRFALQPKGSYLWFSRSTIIKHELGHFAREAQVLANGRSPLAFLETRSLFAQEQRGWSWLPYNALVVLPREEAYAWWYAFRGRK